MAKTTGPFHSIDASGSIAKTMTAGKWRTRPVMRQHVRPTNPQTTSQQANRQLMADAIIAWRALTVEEKAAQGVLGAALTPPIPGYNYFLQQYILSPPSPSPYYTVGADCRLYHAYWDGTAIDHSEKGNNGTPDGATFGEYQGANALIFDGNNDRLAITPILGLSTFSYYAWYWRDSSKAANAQMLAGYNAEKWLGYPANIDRISDRVKTVYGSMLTVLNATQLNAWFLWAFTYTDPPGDCNGYANSVITSDSPMVQTPGTISIGTIGAYSAADTTYNHKGAIGEILIFDTVKSPADILAYFNATKSRYGF